jgi:Lon protease-like protein
MSDDLLTALGNFSGTARLFPLPNLVLYPAVVQPLHIFEARYRELMADALAGDRLITLALLQPGWEQDYHQSPPIYPVVCVGRVFQEERLADGRWNLLLHGLARARVEEELKTDKPYRSARVRLLADVAVAAEEAARLRRGLGERTAAWLAAQGAAPGQLGQLLDSPLPLGALCDVFAFALPLDMAVKQELLEETDVGARARRLIARLETHGPPATPQPPPGRKFPPEFSRN